MTAKDERKGNNPAGNDQGPVVVDEPAEPEAPQPEPEPAGKGEPAKVKVDKPSEAK
jgi:hypothetical protein